MSKKVGETPVSPSKDHSDVTLAAHTAHLLRRLGDNMRDLRLGRPYDTERMADRIESVLALVATTTAEVRDVAAVLAEVERLRVWHESAANLMAAYAGRSAEARGALAAMTAERDEAKRTLDHVEALLPDPPAAFGNEPIAERVRSLRRRAELAERSRADHEREVREACIACVEHDRAVARCDRYSGRTEWEVVHPAESPSVVDRVLAERAQVSTKTSTCGPDVAPAVVTTRDAEGGPGEGDSAPTLGPSSAGGEAGHPDSDDMLCNDVLDVGIEGLCHCKKPKWHDGEHQMGAMRWIKDAVPTIVPDQPPPTGRGEATFSLYWLRAACIECFGEGVACVEVRTTHDGGGVFVEPEAKANAEAVVDEVLERLFGAQARTEGR